MKKILSLVLTAVMLISCKSKTKLPDNDSAKNTTSSNQAQELIKKFKPIIQGVWVKADYINKVIETKSPLASAGLATGLTIIYIDTNDIKQDSIVSMAGYGNHDGANVIIKFRPGKKPSTILFNDGDLSYSIENGDTVLTFPQYNESKKQFILTKYIRILKKLANDDLDFGMHFYINGKLVAGNYRLIDSAENQSNINFSDDGKVTGFLNFKSYIINIDLNSDANDNLDGIYFKTVHKENNNYTFKIIADTLNLYDTNENADSTELVLGKLKYKLVRKR